MSRFETIVVVLFLTNLTLVQAEEKPTKEEAENLKRLLNGIQTKGTDPAVSDFVRKGKWTKRKYIAVELQTEIKKSAAGGETTARASWKIATFLTGPFNTKVEAEKAQLPEKPGAVSRAQFWAEFSLKQGNWEVKDVGFTAPPTNIMKKHSTTTDERDPIHDWWRALGGK